jgi:hypothetical protein
LDLAKTAAKIADCHCFLPSLRAQRSNPAQRRPGLDAESLAKLFTVWKNHSYPHTPYYGTITQIQHFQTVS